MRSVFRRVHAAAAVLLVVGLVVQVFLAGAALTELGGTGDFRFHEDFGYSVLGILTLTVLLTAVAARSERRDVGTAFAVLLLYVVQTSLPGFRASQPALAALHPVNALLLFALSAWYARRAWTMRRAAAPSGPAAAGIEPASN
jgi:hypothetical protein